MGIGRPRPALSRLRVKTAKRTIVPLSVDEVARFWSSFRNSRDLAIVGLMLLQGLRSQEVLDLNRDDLAVVGSADPRARQRQQDPLPAAGPGSELNCWITICGWSGRRRRPDALFVSLKGPARGARMTPAGLRSLFRYHRRTTGVKMANPHRFRHTFASDMVRAGVSLPALMQLMGHAQIQTTMVYVQVTPLEVYQQYARAVAQHIRPVPGTRIVKLSRYAPLEHPLVHQFQRAIESLTAALSSGLSPSIPWHRARLPDLSRRRPSCRLFARSVAP